MRRGGGVPRSSAQQGDCGRSRLHGEVFMFSDDDRIELLFL